MIDWIKIGKVFLFCAINLGCDFMWVLKLHQLGTSGSKYTVHVLISIKLDLTLASGPWQCWSPFLSCNSALKYPGKPLWIHYINNCVIHNKANSLSLFVFHLCVFCFKHQVRSMTCNSVNMTAAFYLFDRITDCRQNWRILIGTTVY